jgi:3-methyladenine DNA glycosylase AlkD
MAGVNNWDLVDASAYKIMGDFLLNRDRGILYELTRSNDLWKQRIAMIATFQFIRHKQYEDTLKIAEILLHHKHDLIHKAVGWMLREMGKRDFATEERFLRRFYKEMPRTMLRYAIEKFPEELRQDFLKGRI